MPSSVTLDSPKKLRVSERGLCIAQGRLRFADSRDRSSLIFSGFPNSAVVSVRLTGGVVERFGLLSSVLAVSVNFAEATFQEMSG